MHQENSPQRTHLKDKVTEVITKRSVIDKFKDANANPKKEFIQKYGVELKMTAAYTYTAMFYRQNQDYLITINTLVSPSDVSYYDYDNITPTHNSEDEGIKEEKQKINKCLIIKAYQLIDKKYRLVNQRRLDPSYKNKVCISEDGAKLAIVRQISQTAQGGAAKFTDAFKKVLTSGDETVIDIFDCNDVSFFLEQEPLLPTDSKLIHSIRDPKLNNQRRMDQTFMRFSLKSAYIYLVCGRQDILVYDLQKLSKDITETVVACTIPSIYEAIINFAVNEEDIQKSLLACKKTDFRNIDIFTMEFITEMNDENDTEKDFKSVKELIQQHQKGTIRYDDLDYSGIKLKFSEDLSTVFFSNKEQNLILTLATRKESSHQRSMHHLEGKHTIQITKDGDKGFIVVTAKPQDNEITIKKTLDNTVKFTFPIRYVEEHVQIRDIQSLPNSDRIRLIVTRDDEEFFIYEFDTNNTMHLWQRLYENSNFVFQWPYICYQEGQSHIVVLNAFDPKKITIINLASQLPKDGYISDLTITQSLDLYILVTTPDQYLLFERDLDRVMSLIIHTTDYTGKQIMKRVLLHSTTSFKKSQVSELEDDGGPVNIIDRKDLGNGKQPYKMIVRGSSHKELIQLNLERIVFFIVDFQIFAMTPNGKPVFVDTCYRHRMINENLLVYTPKELNGQQSNTIKYLKVGYSEYTTFKALEEFGGKLQCFHVSQNQIFVVCSAGDKQFLKIYEVNDHLQSRLKYQQEIKKTNNFLGTFLTTDIMFNSCLPNANSLYNIVTGKKKQVQIYHYNNLLPLSSHTSSVTYNSPLIDINYRKMVYFVSNKSMLEPKEAIILPFLDDHFVMFNTRQNITSFCNFATKKTTKALKNQIQDIVNLLPFQQQLLRYSLNGQLQERVDLRTLYERYGDKVLATSPNGKLFLHAFEDSIDNQLSIVQIAFHSETQTIEQKATAEKAEVFLKKVSKYNSTVEAQQNQIDIKVLETIDVNEIKLSQSMVEEFKCNRLDQLIKQFEALKCKPVYRINDNKDIVIAFKLTGSSEKHKHSQDYLKEMFVLKKLISTNPRDLLCVRIDTTSGDEVVNVQVEDKNKGVAQLRISLLNRTAVSEEYDSAYTTAPKQPQFKLQDCFDFCLSNTQLLLWSKDRIFYGSIDKVNTNDGSVKVKQSKFQIEDVEEAHIMEIAAKQMSKDDEERGNCYVNIKINYENTKSMILKYNLFKEKEFTSFDCSLDAEVFFDSAKNSYILDKHTIIDITQGVPLYFFNTGTTDLNKKYLIGENIVSGARFSKDNTHFMVRNKVHLPYSYFSLVMIENNLNKDLANSTYDPSVLYWIDGETALHHYSDSYKNLSFLLEQYEKTDQKMINLLLLKNSAGHNVLDLAVLQSSSRCVNLILSKLGTISMNNIHQVKKNFSKFLDQSSFEQYLGLCYFSTCQMVQKTVLSCKKTHNSDTYVASHPTCFLDKQFYKNFCTDEPMRPVTIRAFDAGWIFKSTEGKQFIMALSNSENMNYFQQESVRLLVNYQWMFYKTSIIKYLFLPFIANMLLFNLYAVIVFEEYRKYPSDPFLSNVNIFLQMILLLFMFQTVYVELRQILYHRIEYLSSIWNLFDLMTVVLTPFIVIMDILDVSDSFVRPIMAFCLLFFYLRLFYFLRIFDATAHLVRTILEISNDIRYFLLVLLIGIIGFGGSFLVLSKNNQDDSENKFKIYHLADSVLYSYKLILGEFDIEGFNNATNSLLLWVLFVISTLFTMIILLNMLIAIMGESFNRVNEQSENQRVREHLQLIVENDFLIDRAKVFKNVKYLIAIKDDNEDDEQDEVTEKLLGLKKGFSKKLKGMQSHLKTILESGVYVTKQFKSLKSEMQEIKDLLKKQHLGQEREEALPAAVLRHHLNKEEHAFKFGL